jgi:hypothetical protein
VKEHGFDRAIRIMLIVCGALLFLICLGTLWGPAVGTRLGPIQYFLFERKWVSRGDLDFAGFPVMAYEVAPGNTDWGGVTGRWRYFFDSGSSGGEELHAQYSSPERGQLASLGMTTISRDITGINPWLADAPVDVRRDVTCGPVDIAWANDQEQCTCTIDGRDGACLTWWTDEGLFVIVSAGLNTEELQAFANRLTPISK